MEFQVGPGSRRGAEQEQRMVLFILGCLQGPTYVP